jgi:hypothetical protein
MGPADSTHKVDYGHDHHARCYDLHTQRYRPAAPRSYNPGASGDNHEQKCSPGF